MKKILIVLAAGITILSCNDADTEATAGTASSSNTSTVSQDSLDKLNAISKPANEPGSTTSETPVDPANQTTIKWLDGSDRDFGKMKEGENLDVSFRFQNTGTKPLIISRVWAQCGCTVAETPQKPYAPGETGVIKASFNSTAKPGMNSKQVYMNANTDPAMSTLTFRVDVKAKSK